MKYKSVRAFFALTFLIPCIAAADINDKQDVNSRPLLPIELGKNNATVDLCDLNLDERLKEMQPAEPEYSSKSPHSSAAKGEDRDGRYNIGARSLISAKAIIASTDILRDELKRGGLTKQEVYQHTQGVTSKVDNMAGFLICVSAILQMGGIDESHQKFFIFDPEGIIATEEQVSDYWVLSQKLPLDIVKQCLSFRWRINGWQFIRKERDIPLINENPGRFD